MNSPLTALAWEIGRRGRRSAGLALVCVTFCAFINLVVLGKVHIPQGAQDVFPTLFGMLMALSFLLLMGVFNYTEYNSSKEWNGFPYRLFTLPLRTWQLVSLPMLLGVASVEALYHAWIKLVWTHEDIQMPEWFAIVLGAYVVFYQTTIWCLAGFRLTRIVVLGLGGVSSIAVAALPFFATFISLPWLSEEHLIAIVLGAAALAFVVAWATVARQRHGGGRRQGWVNGLVSWVSDALPARTKDFASPAAAQFWYEWRHTGWLLPVCIAFLLLIVVAPLSWLKRDDPAYVIGRLLVIPVVMSFAIGKGFIKCEFWSTNLALPTFLAVRPLSAGAFVITKMKVAALSVAIAWLLIGVFLALWLSLWANNTSLKPQLFMFHAFYPHSWLLITVLSYAALMVFSWRLMVSGLWVGLSGNRSYYVGSLALQALVPALLLVAVGIWSDTIDREIQNHPLRVQSVMLNGMSWGLALLVIAKFWFAAFSWSKITSHWARRYLILCLGALACFLTLAVLASPPFDMYRTEHLYLLGALLIFPVARLGIAPLSFAKNRHR